MIRTGSHDPPHARVFHACGYHHSGAPGGRLVSVPVQRVLAALEAHGCEPRQNGKGWSARCPSHDDQRPSLSMSAGDDGRALLKCHAGCRWTAIVESLGLEASALFTPANGETVKTLPLRKSALKKSATAAPGGRIVATYDYVDKTGELLYQVCRYQPKGFAQRRPGGNGAWIWKLGRVCRVLYRLPQLVKSPAETIVYVVEGEKDADRLASVDLLATTCAGGAEKWKGLDDSPLEGRRVVVIPDADEPGRRHAQDVARRLHSRAASVRVLELPDLADGEDVSDWLDAGGNVEDLDHLAAEAPEWEPTPEPSPLPYASVAEARSALRKMAGRAEGLREGTAALAEDVFEFFDRKGMETLEGTIDYPVAYVSKALGVTRQRLYQLRDWVRVRRLVAQAPTRVDIVSERVARPLIRLLADHADDVPQVFGHARQMAEAEGKKLGGRHTRAAVEQIIPPRSPGPAPEPPAPEVPTLLDLWRHIAKCLDLANEVPGVPRDLRGALSMVTDLAYEFAHERHGPARAARDPGSDR